MMVTFFVALRIWKYVSVSSTVAVATGFILGIISGITGSMLTFGGIITLAPSVWSIALCYGLLLCLVTYRHKKNFSNIKKGVEPKVKIFDK